MRTILFLTSLSLLICSCSSINKKLGLEDDNFMEEIVEAVIETYTGLDLDLTP